MLNVRQEIVVTIAIVVFFLLCTALYSRTQMPKAFGNAPTVSACGTSPLVTGTDMAGTITFGTGVVTSCLLTFSQAYSAAPVCVLTPSLLTAVLGVTAETTSTVTIGASVSVPGVGVKYHCIVP